MCNSRLLVIRCILTYETRILLKGCRIQLGAGATSIYPWFAPEKENEEFFMHVYYHVFLNIIGPNIF